MLRKLSYLMKEGWSAGLQQVAEICVTSAVVNFFTTYVFLEPGFKPASSID